LHQRRWVWLAVACSAAFGILTIPILQGKNWPGEWQVVAWAASSRTLAWTSLMQTITFMGSAAMGIGLSAGMSVAQFLRFRGLRRQVWLPAAAMLSSAPVNFALRAVCGRLRPGVSYVPHRLPELYHPFQRWSYPSGHAMTAMICYGVAAYLVAQAVPHRWWMVWTVLVAWLLAVGYSRVYLGVHWPTDVIGGYLVGAAWVALHLAIWAGSRREDND